MFGERGTDVSRQIEASRGKRWVKNGAGRLFWLPEKMTGRLFWLLFACVFLAICCFRFLMQRQDWVYVKLVEHGVIQYDPEKMMEEMQEKAKNINFGEVGTEELIRLLDIEKYNDGYTYIAFYGEDSLYQFRAIEPPDWDSLTSHFFWYDSVEVYTGMDYIGYLEFADTTEQVMVYSMHQVMMILPYFFFSLAVSLLFFCPVICYVWNRMRYVGKLKDEILIMAEGDLEHLVTVKGKDEIGILAKNLDGMRLALDENIRREQEGIKANRDLISSISHDLRTPMTTLYGYLEIIGQKKCPLQKQEEYIARCIEKVEEIRALSDKMFEYALVYEKNEKAELAEVSLWELMEEIEGNREFLRLKGFQVQADYQAPETVKVCGNRALFQRMSNNLFSNILKYGQKDRPVLIKTAVEKGNVEFMFLNWKREDCSQVESNKIGLKSVQKMAKLQGGSVFVAEEEDTFAVSVRLPAVARYFTGDACNMEEKNERAVDKK